MKAQGTMSWYTAAWWTRTALATALVGAALVGAGSASVGQAWAGEPAPAPAPPAPPPAAPAPEHDPALKAKFIQLKIDVVDLKKDIAHMQAQSKDEKERDLLQESLNALDRIFSLLEDIVANDL